MSFHETRSFASACANCPIRQNAVCAGCIGEDRAALEASKFHRQVPAGKTLVFAGDSMDYVASIISGTATLHLTLQDGRRQMLGLRMPSDFIGRPGKRTAALEVTATTDLVLCCFRQKSFEEMMLSTPKLAGRLLQMSLNELDGAREWMLLLGRKTALEKLASFLVLVARRTVQPGKANRPVTFEIPVTRVDMADYLGLTVETISRQIAVLKQDSVISLFGQRGVTVRDFGLLLEAAGDDADGGLIA